MIVKAVDRKTRKMMTMKHALHPWNNVDSPYIPRKMGEHGILQVHQTVVEEEEEKDIGTISEE